MIKQSTVLIEYGCNIISLHQVKSTRVKQNSACSNENRYLCAILLGPKVVNHPGLYLKWHYLVTIATPCWLFIWICTQQSYMWTSCLAN